QTSDNGNTFLLAVAFFFSLWEVPSGSGNFLTSSGNALCILFLTIVINWRHELNSNKASWVKWKSVLASKEKGGLGVGKVSKAGSRSCWRNIVNEERILSNQGIKVLDYMRIKLGNRESTAFWDDNWIGGKVLKLENSLCRSIRGGVEHVQFNELSNMLQSISLMPYSDRWVWSLEGSGEFFVASIRKIIDDNRFSTVDTRTL
nr:hypothetical protein [Tanacetum cinerariifolium]